MSKENKVDELDYNESIYRFLEECDSDWDDWDDDSDELEEDEDKEDDL